MNVVSDRIHTTGNSGLLPGKSRLLPGKIGLLPEGWIYFLEKDVVWDFKIRVKTGERLFRDDKLAPHIVQMSKTSQFSPRFAKKYVNSVHTERSLIRDEPRELLDSMYP